VVRGLGQEDAEAFLRPTVRGLLFDPLLPKDMERAVKRTAKAIENAENVAIYGDYDVDGVTSVSLLLNYFKAIGVERNVSYYIPDRVAEGYGVNEAALMNVGEKASLVIMVDCGTTSVNEIQKANARGIDSVVLDHHSVGNVDDIDGDEGYSCKLPPTIVVNPHRLDQLAVGDCGRKQNGNQRTARAEQLQNPCKVADFAEAPPIRQPANFLRPWLDLCAAGVVFCFLVALQRFLKENGIKKPTELPDLMLFLDLVALGTVCDVMPLRGLNRAFVRRGLELMHKSQLPGVRALIDAAGVRTELSAHHLGFTLGPRLNAAGRIGASSLGVRLLTTADSLEAKEIAENLNALNVERQKMEECALNEAIEIVWRLQLVHNPVLLVGPSAESFPHPESTNQQPFCGDINAFSQKELVAGDAEHRRGAVLNVLLKPSPESTNQQPFCENAPWHPGIVGLLASRLKEKYSRPAFVFTIEMANSGSNEHIARGSCRSVEGIDVGELVRQAVSNGLLLGGGGHKMAAGFSFKLEKQQAFYDFLNEQTADFMQTYVPSINVDAQISIRGLTRELMSQIRMLEPFGVGNHEPKFCIRNVYAKGVRVIGGRDGKTRISCVQCSLCDETGALIDAVCFGELANNAEVREIFETGRRMDVVGTLKINTWRAGERLQFILEDVITCSGRFPTINAIPQLV
jgi:single-stranded-DNA-specific exonuclease